MCEDKIHYTTTLVLKKKELGYSFIENIWENITSGPGRCSCNVRAVAAAAAAGTMMMIATQHRDISRVYIRKLLKETAGQLQFTLKVSFNKELGWKIQRIKCGNKLNNEPII